MKLNESVNVDGGYDLESSRYKINSVFIILKNMSNIKYLRFLHFLSLSIILFFRRSDALLNSQPWAEDGTIFLQQAIEHSFHSLFILYSGYLHTIPRLVTVISLQFGFTNAPLIMNAFALFISSACVSYFFNSDFRFIIRNDLLRLVCTVVIICLPLYEIYLNITNIQWFLSFFTALWGIKFIFNSNSFAKRDKMSSFKEILCIIFVSLSFMTAPLSFILIPFLISAYVYQVKLKALSNLDIIFYLIPIIFAIIHVIICTSSNISNSFEFPSFYLIVKSFSLQIVTKLFYNNTEQLVVEFGFLPAYILTTLFLVILAISTSKKKQFFVDVILLLMIFMSIFYFIFIRADWYPPELIMAQPRYIFFPITFFLILFIRQIDTFDKKSYIYVLLLFLFALMLVNVTLNYNLRPFDDYNFRLYSKYYDPDGQYFCNIPINPYFSQLPFSMNFPCNQSLIILFPGLERDPKEFSSPDISMQRPTFTTQSPASCYLFSPKTISGVNKVSMYQHALDTNYIYFYNIKIPENSKLSLSIALDPQVWYPNKGDGVLFELYVNETNIDNKIFSHYIDPKNNCTDRKWNDFEIDLSKFANEQITLIFSTQPGPINDGSYDWAWWGDAIISKK